MVILMGFIISISDWGCSSTFQKTMTQIWKIPPDGDVIDVFFFKVT